MKISVTTFISRPMIQQCNFTSFVAVFQLFVSCDFQLTTEKYTPITSLLDTNNS